jgi:hypothetical protein
LARSAPFFTHQHLVPMAFSSAHVQQIKHDEVAARMISAIMAKTEGRRFPPLWRKLKAKELESNCC